MYLLRFYCKIWGFKNNQDVLLIKNSNKWQTDFLNIFIKLHSIQFKPQNKYYKNVVENVQNQRVLEHYFRVFWRLTRLNIFISTSVCTLKFYS